MSLTNYHIKSFVKTTENAAIGASLFKGKGNKIAADQAAVDKMREELNKINMKGRVVIGEGEMDEAPMLYIGEKVGNNNGKELDIAVDPLEGTNFTAKNLPNALSVLAVTEKGNLLHAPDTYMEKIAVGPNLPKNIIDLDFSIKKNIEILADVKNTTPDKLTACVLKRPRHNKIVEELNLLNVKINFISDGDVSGVIFVSNPKTNVDLYIGTGGSPEGILAAAALRCFNCQMQTRFVFQDDNEIDRAKKAGINDLKRKYYIEDMVRGDVIFCATGVTNGDILNGVKDLGDFYETETLILHDKTKTNKIIKNKLKK